MQRRRLGAAEFGIGLLLGLAAGTVLGILLAPSSGAQTRGEIASRATGIRSTVAELIDQARESIELATVQLEKVVGLQERHLRRKLNDIKAQLEEYNLNEA